MYHILNVLYHSAIVYRETILYMDISGDCLSAISVTLCTISISRSDLSPIQWTGAQYFDSSWSATFFLATVGDFNAATTASRVGGGSKTVSNQCFNTSHIKSVWLIWVVLLSSCATWYTLDDFQFVNTGTCKYKVVRTCYISILMTQKPCDCKHTPFSVTWRRCLQETIPVIQY